MSIALVDYGAGNLTSVLKALKAVGADVRVVSDVEGTEGASAIVVPGVGHFSATASLGPEWRTAIQAALGRGVPLRSWRFSAAPTPHDLSFVRMPSRRRMQARSSGRQLWRSASASAIAWG